MFLWYGETHFTASVNFLHDLMSVPNKLHCVFTVLFPFLFRSPEVTRGPDNVKLNTEDDNC